MKFKELIELLVQCEDGEIIQISEKYNSMFLVVDWGVSGGVKCYYTDGTSTYLSYDSNLIEVDKQIYE